MRLEASGSRNPGQDSPSGRTVTTIAPRLRRLSPLLTALLPLLLPSCRGAPGEAPAGSGAAAAPASPGEPAAALGSGPANPSEPMKPSAAPRTEVATLAAGCFWCIEAVLQRVDGVLKVESGYTGGTLERPTYE